MTMALPFVFEWQENKLWLKLQNYYVILTLDFRQESAHSFEILIVFLSFNCVFFYSLMFHNNSCLDQEITCLSEILEMSLS